MSFAIDRRTVLKGAGASLLAFAPPAWGATPLYIATTLAEEGHLARVFDGDGQVIASLELPGRGHGVAVSPTNRTAVVIARRPDRYALAFRRDTGEVTTTLTAPEGRHFYGHGTFSPDGRLLLTTENDYENGRGAIGVWDAADGFARIGEWESFGVGPHDVLRMPAGNIVAVANGGIVTHPDSGRDKLNLNDMSPSLVLIDARSGERLNECKLPRTLHQLSIRHLAASRSGVIVAAMQYEGPKQNAPPLVFTWDGGVPRILEAKWNIQRAMRNYCLSVAVDASDEIAAVSCPHGNLVTFWDIAAGKLAGAVGARNARGVAATGHPREFLITSGDGTRMVYDTAHKRKRPLPVVPALRWDSHVTAG